MFKRKIAEDPKQYGPKREKGMSTSYQGLPKSGNNKENSRNSPSIVRKTREKVFEKK